MKVLHTLSLVGLLAVAGGLGACSDEKKGEPEKMTAPAPAADPGKPTDGSKPSPAKPADEKH